ncbi:LysR family transcriptional regulator [Bradyrhizobium sp. NAS80.1]|uniref:LysR family transcriptional regulator n=1 Tax=Bradyrhizobium sp. NAS80.1 TaxID=1680159 RepID=UPI00143E0358|nr:LysR family transcriptional regulator [Bradyrhizobium sp. NAS80.1]
MISELKAFVLLADTGSIQRSAERLRLTQPAVTRQIQRLESMLDADLLDRRVKPPTMTPAGLVVVDRARAILASIDELRQQVAADAEPSGPFRLGVSHSIADAGLADILEALRQRYHRLELRLISGWMPELLQKVKEGALDAAILLAAGDDARVPLPNGQAVAKENIMIVAPRGLALSRQPSLKQLSEFGWVLTPDASCGARRALRASIERQGGQFRLAAEVQDIELQVSLISKGIGIGILPRRKITPQHKRRIRIVPIRNVALEMAVWVVQSPFVANKRKCIEFLADECGKYYRS